MAIRLYGPCVCMYRIAVCVCALVKWILYVSQRFFCFFFLLLLFSIPTCCDEYPTIAYSHDRREYFREKIKSFIACNCALISSPVSDNTKKKKYSTSFRSFNCRYFYDGEIYRNLNFYQKQKPKNSDPNIH